MRSVLPSAAVAAAKASSASLRTFRATSASGRRLFDPTVVLIERGVHRSSSLPAPLSTPPADSPSCHRFPS